MSVVRRARLSTAASPYASRERRAAQSLADALDRTGGIGPGFDFLRIALALLIFYGHTTLVTGRTSTLSSARGFDMAEAHLVATSATAALDYLYQTLKTRAYVLFVPMFFALSGFLVAGSALRVGRTVPFLKNRLLRIFPALCVEVALSALILGTVFTHLDLAVYFTDPQFFRYFGNIAGIITYQLPGVFLDNPKSGIVNGALWTLPAEFQCYLLISGLIISGLLWRRKTLLALYAVAAAFFLPASVIFGHFTTDTFFSVPAVVAYFATGVLLFVFRDHVPLSPWLAVPAAIASIVCVFFASAAFVMVVPLTYLTIWLGMQPLLAIPWLKGRDYSYGIYLYNFPILQAMVASVPGINRWQLLAFGGLVSVGFAVASWHWIEKPFLKLKSGKPRLIAPQ